MSVTLELPPNVARQISETNIAEPTPKIWTAAELLKLTPAERNPILEAMAKEAAPLYEADLALPPHERELTAFEILNEYDPIIDEYDEAGDAR